MACGEGYGSDVLAARAAEVVGVDANPEAHEHARLRYARPNLRFERDLVESFDEPLRRDRLPADDRARRRSPAALLERFARCWRPAGRLRLDAEPAHPGARRAPRSPTTPGTCASTRAAEYRELLRAALRAGRAARPLPRPQAARARAGDPARLGPRPPGAAAHQALLRPLHPGDQRRATSRCGPGDLDRALDFVAVCQRHERMADARRAGDLAIVLHSPHALRRGLRHLSVRRGVAVRRGRPLATCRCWRSPSGLTMTVTPVLADQLEADGRAASGCARSCATTGSTPPSATPPTCRRRAAARPARPRPTRYTARAGAPRRGSAATRCAPSRRPHAAGRVALMASAATHAVLPLLATRAGARLQLDAGLRSHRRRFGAAAAASGCPSAPTRPGSSGVLAERGRRATSASTRARTSEPLDALAPGRCRGGPGRASDRLGGDPAGSGRLDGYPSDPAYARVPPASRCDGMRLWTIARRALRPGRGRDAGRASTPREFLAAVARRLRALPRASAAAAACCVFAIDTELLGHWWCGGPDLAARGARRRPSATASRLLTLPAGARASTSPRSGPLPRLDLGRGQGPARPGTRPPVADLAWAARRLELRLLRALGRGGSRGAAAARAARELLAAPVERLGLPGPPRAGGRLPVPARHRPRRGRCCEAIDSAAAADPRMRTLAPDLSLAPLLEP